MGKSGQEILAKQKELGEKLIELENEKKRNTVYFSLIVALTFLVFYGTFYYLMEFSNFNGAIFGFLAVTVFFLVFFIAIMLSRRSKIKHRIMEVKIMSETLNEVSGLLNSAGGERLVLEQLDKMLIDFGKKKNTLFYKLKKFYATLDVEKFDNLEARIKIFSWVVTGDN